MNVRRWASTELNAYNDVDALPTGGARVECRVEVPGGWCF